MAAEDYFDFFGFDDEDGFVVRSVTCTLCGETELEWDWEYRYGERCYFLVDADGERHECPASDEDEFEVIT